MNTIYIRIYKQMYMLIIIIYEHTLKMWCNIMFTHHNGTVALHGEVQKQFVEVRACNSHTLLNCDWKEEKIA